MAITRQAYEWRGVVPTGTTVSKNGHPILGTWTAGSGLTYDQTISVPAFEGGMPLDIMWGGKGNNLKTSAIPSRTSYHHRWTRLLAHRR